MIFKYCPYIKSKKDWCMYGKVNEKYRIIECNFSEVNLDEINECPFFGKENDESE